MDAEIAARVELACLPGLRRAHAQRLIDRFGSAAAVFRESVTARRASLPPAISAALERASEAPTAERALAQAAARGIRALAPGTPGFPPLLAAIPDPPLVVWLRGEVSNRPALAIVGARRASARGLASAREFACEAARAGISVVSGLAYGIDAAAHEGALAAPGHTLAVLASGLDSVTPKGHTRLAQRILDAGGAWLSEHAPGSGAHPHHFPERNRLISGIAGATLIVEAREKSGSLWTARHALEQGREVLAVPGPIDTDQCRGSNRLLRDGAAPALEPADAIEALVGPLAARPECASPEPPGSGTGAAILAALADGPRDVDALARELRRGPAELAAALLELELAGLLRRDGVRIARVRPG